MHEEALPQQASDGRLPAGDHPCSSRLNKSAPQQAAFAPLILCQLPLDHQTSACQLATLFCTD